MKTTALAKEVTHPLRLDAVRALAAWPDESAILALLDLAAAPSADGVVRGLCLRGVARLARESGAAAAERARWLERAMGMGAPPDIRRDLISAAAGLRHPTALRLIEAALGDADVASEAATAVARAVLGETPDPKRTLTAEEARLLKRAESLMPDGDLRRRGREALTPAR